MRPSDVVKSVVHQETPFTEQGMTPAQFQREMNYRIAISFAKVLHAKGLISQGEFVHIDTMLTENLCPVWGAL